MPIAIHTYVSVDELKGWLGITGSAQDTNLTYALEAATNLIDEFCGRVFYVPKDSGTDVLQTRYYDCEFSDYVTVDDISTTTGLVVQTLHSDGTVDQSFNGIAEITLFDKASDVKTLRNDPSSFEKSFKLQKNILYSGKVTVQNGVMDFEFILPLDINYEYGLGRLSYYAVSDKGTDAAGYFEDFVIGGTSNNGVIDNEGPIIDIFFDGYS